MTVAENWISFQDVGDPKRGKGGEMRAKLFFVFLLTMLLTAFSGVAFGGVPGKISCPQDLVTQQFKTLSKSVAKTVALAGTGSISGRVTDRLSTTGVGGIRVTAHPQSALFCDSSSYSATTTANGDYTIPGVIAGPYTVSFEQTDKSITPVYVTQWYNNKLSEESAAIVQVTELNTTQNINAALDKGGSISGKVTCSAEALMSSFSISAVGRDTGYTASGSATVMATIPLPGYDGSYALTGLPSDTYTVSFDSNFTGGSSPSCIPQDYPSQVTVVAPLPTANINMTLTPGGSITGILLDNTNSQPIQGALVYATAPGGSVVGASNFGISDDTGAFTISGLASGSYDVVINGRVIYDSTDPSVHKGYILLKQQSVSVSSPDTTDIGTKRLTPGGTIKGTVTNKSAGAPLMDVTVIGYDAVSGEMISYASTDAAGAYTLTGFATGNYKVQFIACQGSYAEQWYNGKTAQASANPVAVTAPTATTGINGVLDLAANPQPVDGTCGSSNGGTFTSAPTDLCSTGTSESFITTASGWQWTCAGLNGGNTSPTCSASKQDATPPVTTASPSGGTYAAPVTVTLTANEAATIYYTTNGSEPTTASTVYSNPLSIAISAILKFFAKDAAGNSEAVRSESYVITPIVNGACGSSNGGTFATAPTSGLCTTGTASTVTESSTWNWSCQGSNGGSNATCSANKSVVTNKPGDCDNNDIVTIAEVQSAINMFLGINEVKSCVDTNGIGGVTIDEVQKTINGFLGL